MMHKIATYLRQAIEMFSADDIKLKEMCLTDLEEENGDNYRKLFLS